MKVMDGGGISSDVGERVTKKSRKMEYKNDSEKITYLNIINIS